jgi:hypothetical protein
MAQAKRRRSRPKPRYEFVGVAWYSEIEWAKLKRLAADPEILEDTYEEWCRVYENAVKTIEREGTRCIPVELRIDEVAQWCSEKGRPLDGAARAEFAALHVRNATGEPGGA